MGIEQLLIETERKKSAIKAEEKNKTEFVTNLILNTDFDDTKIASLAVVGFDFVGKIRASLAKKQKI